MIIFYDELTKASNPTERALEQLRAFLESSEPSLVRVLVNTWRSQGKAITYKELREAILYAQRYGGLEGSEFILELYEDWRQDYSRLVVEKIAPRWEKAMKAATEKISTKYPHWHWDATSIGVRQWASDAGAIFVTNSTNTQIHGLRKLIERAATMQDLSVDTLAHAIRPMVGLTHQQAGANMNYYRTLLEHGVSQRQATDLAIRFGARQHRYRAQNIARTEMAFAYNQGAYMGVKEAQAKGYMGKMMKQWVTADDERTCKICAALDGVQIDMDAEFNFKTRLTHPGIKRMAPAHPSCRCSVIFVEAEPPKFDSLLT